MLNTAAYAAEMKHGTELIGLDVSERFPFADAFLIVTGEVERNVQAISDGIEEALLDAGHKILRREGRAEGRWILLDAGDLVIHIFHSEEREYYEIERLWRDCPAIPLEHTAPGLVDQDEVR